MKGFRKKGVTLVELIVSIAISVVVIGAACIALSAGMKGSRNGLSGVAGHGNAKLLETWLQNVLPTASSASFTAEKAARQPGASTDLWNFYFRGKEFVVEKNGAVQLTVDGIDRIDFTAEAAGPHTRMNYKIHADDSGGAYLLSGGIVMNNCAAGNFSRTLSASDSAPEYFSVWK